MGSIAKYQYIILSISLGYLYKKRNILQVEKVIYFADVK